MKHARNVIILILVGSAVLLFGVNIIDLAPIAASAEAQQVDWLFGLHMNVIAFLYVLVNGIMLYSVFAFRRKPDDDSEGAYIHGNAKLEIAWTIIPLITVLFFAFLGSMVLRNVTQAAPNSMDVTVIARQWSWTFEYPEYGIVSTELNLPVGRQVNFKLRSEDVVHSFWVPEWRMKHDTVPGQDKYIRLTPSEEGTFKVRCAELCGTAHAYMLADINVMSQEDFDIWVQKKLGIYEGPEGGEGGGEVDPVAEGQALAQSAGCLACHSVDGSPLVGPTWKGLFGKTETLADGSTVVVDEAYLIESIIDPSAKIVNGFQDVMPKNYGDIFSDQEIGYIIEYIKSLQ